MKQLGTLVFAAFIAIIASALTVTFIEGPSTGADKFRRMIDNATRALINRGVIDDIIKKHERYPGALIRVDAPYEE